MRKKPHRKKPIRKPKPRGRQIVYGDDGCEMLAPKKKRKRRDKSRSGT